MYRTMDRLTNVYIYIVCDYNIYIYIQIVTHTHTHAELQVLVGFGGIQVQSAYCFQLAVCVCLPSRFKKCSSSYIPIYTFLTLSENAQIITTHDLDVIVKHPLKSYSRTIKVNWVFITIALTVTDCIVVPRLPLVSSEFLVVNIQTRAAERCEARLAQQRLVGAPRLG